MVLATVTLAAVSCGPKKQKQEEQPKPKMLVVYYSQTSNTQKVATEIATRLDADLQEIVPVEPYEGDFEATINRGKKELDEGIFPEIQPVPASKRIGIAEGKFIIPDDLDAGSDEIAASLLGGDLF